MAVKKAFTCVSLFALAFSVQPAFAQTGGNTMPSGGTAASPAPAAPGNPAAAPAKHHGHKKHANKAAAPSTGAPASQGN